MSQTDELIAAISEGDTSLYLADAESEPHIVVGADRSITVPSQLKDIAVQYDHNIETVTFDCPRYWDGKDMSAMVIFVLYQRSDNFTGKVSVTNVRVSDTDDSIMHFDWTIRREVTELSGGLSIQICVGETDDTGRTIVHWNSKVCSDMSVSKSLMHVDEDIEQEYPDVITQLWERMGGVEDLSISEGSEKNSLLLNDINTNVAIADNTTVAGSNNTAGVLGYYWNHIDFENNRIYLSKELTSLPTEISDDDMIDKFSIGYEVGDVVSINNDVKYTDSATITDIDNNVITVDKLPFTVINIEDSEDLNSSDYFVFVAEKPNVGLAYSGCESAVFGDGNQALEKNSFIAGGKDNIAKGQNGFIGGGRDNEVWYAARASGRNNKVRSHYGSADGMDSIITGTNSHVRGLGLKATGNYQNINGKFNVEDPISRFAEITGGGSSDNSRKNIRTLDWEGNVVYAGDVIDGSGEKLTNLSTVIRYLGDVISFGGNDYIECPKALGVKDYTISGDGIATTYDKSSDSYYLPITCGIKETIKAADGDHYLLIASPTDAIVHRFNFVRGNDGANVTKVGHSYTLTAWAKTKKGINNAKITVTQADPTHNTILPSNVKNEYNNINSNQWTKLTCTFDIIEGNGDKSVDYGVHFLTRVSKLEDICIDGYCLVDNEYPTVNLLDDAVCYPSNTAINYSFENINGIYGSTINGLVSIIKGGTVDYIPTPVVVNIPVDSEQLNGSLNFTNDNLPMLPVFLGYTSTYEMNDAILNMDFYVSTEIPSKVSQFENDSGYLTEHQDISGKADKPTIEASEDTSYIFEFSNTHNTEKRLAEVTSISFTFGNGEYAPDYTSGLSFNSGATPTAIDYTDSGILNWVGTDCTTVDGLSIFQPSANTHYDIVFYFNGVQFIGLVNGFVPATGNEAV